jgi:hypothetical protein
MKQNFFTYGTLPACIEILGDNIEHLYHTACRTVINSELVEYRIEDVYIQFGVDEYNQIFVTFFNQLGIESEKFVIRARKLATVVETINKVYSNLIKKGFKTMRKDKKTVAKLAAVSNEVSNVTPVASVNCSCSADVNMLVEFIIQKHARSGNLYELAEFVDVPRLFQTKSHGTVNNVVFNGDDLVIEGAYKCRISVNVADMNPSVLREQVEWALQTVIERNKKIIEQTGNSAENDMTLAENETETKEMAKDTTKPQVFTDKVSKKALKRFNEAVGKDINVLKPALKGLNPSASSQRIRCYLKKTAHESGLQITDTSGVALAKNLSQDNVELIRSLCNKTNCNIPPFLQMKNATVASSSKSVMRA